MSHVLHGLYSFLSHFGTHEDQWPTGAYLANTSCSFPIGPIVFGAQHSALEQHDEQLDTHDWQQLDTQDLQDELQQDDEQLIFFKHYNFSYFSLSCSKHFMTSVKAACYDLL